MFGRFTAVSAQAHSALKKKFAALRWPAMSDLDQALRSIDS
jgi:hypothetical protein